MNDNMLELRDVCLAFGPTSVVRGFNLEAAPGEFIAIVGPSGCGKTTLLNILSGYLAPTSGTITRRGNARMVYQQDGLFPWKTVGENIALGLRHCANRSQMRRELSAMMALIGLEGFDDHYPHQLSGGMRQRVELARALAGDTDILLMDEPFSALDYITRLKMRRELALMLREAPRTAVLVTHDIEEAAQLADRVVVLSERPARIRYELRIDLPRPRDLTHPEVVDAMHRILAEMGLEQGGESHVAGVDALEAT
jgi:ABC-type nitrate/sulfonate/bicarbonate transport system ATPase subunit